MADLLTKNKLALWTQNDPAAVEADPFAAEVIDVVSQMAQFLGGHPLWSLAPGDNLAPFDVQLVVLQVCKRVYGNPDQEVATGVGPISSRVLDVAALLLELTESERAVLTRYHPDGDPLSPGHGGLWVLHTTQGDDVELTLPTLYVDDDQQIGMTPDESAYPSWSIPMFSPGDPGDPNNYDEV
jgi:hypothetical protein